MPVSLGQILAATELTLPAPEGATARSSSGRHADTVPGAVVS